MHPSQYSYMIAFFKTFFACSWCAGTLTSAGPALLGRGVSGKGGLPVGLGRSAPPAVLRRGFLQARPLLAVVGVQPAAAATPAPSLLRLPDGVALPLVLGVRSPPPPAVLVQPRRPGGRAPAPAPVRGGAQPAVVRLRQPRRIHPEVRVQVGFALVAGAPAAAAHPHPHPGAHRERVAVLHVVLLHVLCIWICV